MRYDAVVIGSGQGGNPLAFRFADHGWRVALVEQSQVGGTCINWGCTPTKAMVHRAQVARYARDAARWGVRARDVSVDLGAVVEQTQKVVEGFRAGIEKQLGRRPTLRLVRARARLVGPNRVEAGGETLETSRIFLDTGSRPHVPRIPGLEEAGYLTNVEILRVSRLPEHLIVLGGGYVGLEFAQMFRRFGSRVTVIHNGTQLLPREDAEVAAALQAALEEEGISFRLGARTSRVERDSSGVSLSLDGAAERETVRGSDLLVATGRRPNTDALGLETAGVEVDERGYIRVNEKLETTASGIWALGDVKGGPAFTHISYNDFQILHGNLIEGRDLSTEGRIVPYCVFTDPQLGGVGMTEREARAKGKRLKIGRIPMSRVARAVERDETAGMMKIVVDAESDRVLGASILGSEGGELVQILSTLILADRPYTLLKGAIYIHPTLAEGFFALMNDVKPVE